MRGLTSAAMIVVMLVAARPVDAHHSYAAFRDEPITIEGTIDRIEFTNPHTLLTIHDSANRTYTIIWNAAFQLHSMGVQATDLKLGDKVALTGYPSRDPEVRQMAKLRRVQRLRDGWTWQIINGRATVGISPS